jgi:hypothetical protein
VVCEESAAAECCAVACVLCGVFKARIQNICYKLKHIIYVDMMNEHIIIF